MSIRRHRSARAVLLPRLARLVRVAPVPLLVARRRQIGWLLGRAPGARHRVDKAMAAALGPDGYTPAHVDAYFRHLADLVVFSAAAFRSGIRSLGLERYWGDPAAPVIPYHRALERGRGALMVCPHLIGHEIVAGGSTAELPVTVLVRRSSRPEYEALKMQWYAALGVEVVHRPQRGSDDNGLAEMTAAMRALRKNRVLALTPDLIRRPGTGVPVRLFGRQAELPAGAFFLAVRAGAPLLSTFFWEEGGRYWGRTDGPMEIVSTGDRDRDVAAMAQEWTTRFERFVRAHPDMWLFWLDKRWRRWLAAPSSVGPDVPRCG
jgi:lauroyl/myristoyl acyltransferase